jgi:hypothetical protein
MTQPAIWRSDRHLQLRSHISLSSWVDLAPTTMGPDFCQARNFSRHQAVI